MYRPVRLHAGAQHRRSTRQSGNWVALLPTSVHARWFIDIRFSRRVPFCRKWLLSLNHSGKIAFKSALSRNRTQNNPSSVCDWKVFNKVESNKFASTNFSFISDNLKSRNIFLRVDELSNFELSLSDIVEILLLAIVNSNCTRFTFSVQ